MRASRFACPTVRRSMSPPKRVQRTAKGALRAGAIRSMGSFTGEVGRATFGGRYLRCELEGTSRSTIRASADGGGSKEVMWPCTYKMHCSLCALNAGNYRISLPKALRFSCWRHYRSMAGAIFAADCAPNPLTPVLHAPIVHRVTRNQSSARSSLHLITAVSPGLPPSSSARNSS